MEKIIDLNNVESPKIYLHSKFNFEYLGRHYLICLRKKIIRTIF